MKAKEFVPADKPRNFVAKNAIKTTSGAGAHKDKKRADKQGDVKHKAKQFEQGVAEGSGGDQYKIKSIGRDSKGDYYVSPSTGEKVYKSGVKRGDHENPKTGEHKGVAEGTIPFDQCPACRGPIFHESMIAEKQDACYHKVRSRYKVWPSAYASGALVQCRKKGAASWGTGSKKK